MNTPAYTPTNERNEMTWYVISWLVGEPARNSVDVPGLMDWWRTVRASVSDGREPPLQHVVDAWNRERHPGLDPFRIGILNGHQEDSDIDTPCNDYSCRVEIVPEHQAPHLEYMGEDFEDKHAWWWHFRKPDGTVEMRTVIEISVVQHLSEALEQSRKLMDEGMEVAEKRDSEEWRDDKRQLRSSWEEFRTWCSAKHGVMPPPAGPLWPGEHGYKE